MKPIMLMSACAAFALMSACVEAWDPAHEPGAGEDVDDSQHEIVNGIETSARPEVGSIGGCTATLVTPRHFITAAHCVHDYAAEQFGGEFTTGSESFPIDRMMAFHDNVGRFDVAIGRLAVPVPFWVARPARIAATRPPAGTVATVLGYGCNDRNPVEGGGTKRYAIIPWGTATSRLCFGDSGGPVFEGGLYDNGAIIGINSAVQGVSFELGFDVFADPTYFRQRIEQTIRSWEGEVEPGIDRPGQDLYQLSTADFWSCRDACTRETQCHAFSYDIFTATCWLKHAVAEPAERFWMASGLPARIGVFDRPGSDYVSYPSPSADSCASDCGHAGSSCAAFTYDTITGRCWLKDATPGVAACSTCLSGDPRGVEPNSDRPGADYATTSAPDAKACASQCAQDGQCLAFTWNESTHACQLKNAAPATVSAPMMHSGVRRGWEVNIDRPGDDYHSFLVDGPRPEVCQAACARDAQCKAWTLGTAPADGENRCWLKSAIPRTHYKAAAISGIKGMEFF
jgi:hypothetical protein